MPVMTGPGAHGKETTTPPPPPPRGEGGVAATAPPLPHRGGCARRRGTDDDVPGVPVVAQSFRLSIINWLQIASLYVPYVLGAACVAAVAALLPPSVRSEPAKLVAYATTVTQHVAGHWLPYLVLIAACYWLLSVKPPVYLVDFAVYEPPAGWRVSKADIVNMLRVHGSFDEEAVGFMARMLERSGTGEATHMPASTLRIIRPELGPTDPDGKPLPITGPDTSIAAARANAEAVMFSCVERLFASTGVAARDIDFLIVNCSLFCPTPSLASSIVKRFRLRPDVRSYNLGGMGCSAGLISIDLAKQLLQNRANSTAIVVSFEDITQQLYLGSDRSMLLQNTLFRVGGAAVLLSNKPVDGFRAKYKLLNTVRIQDTSDSAHACVFQCQDTAGHRGIALSKDITNVAAKTLRDNLTVLGPHVLPIREQAKVLASLAQRKVVDFCNAMADQWKLARLPGATLESGRWQRPPVYVPDFKLGIQHFCIHAGGRAVIDGIEQNLKLAPHHTAPSRATLHHWGNTSSSSIWYELKYVEGEEDRFRLSKEEGGHVPIARGHRVLQIAFGSGFKCNSAVWLRIN